MKAYVINLKRCSDRKIYMKQLLSQFDFLDVEFIEAVDGKLLSDEEKSKLFNQDKAFQMYGRYLSDGEIGCTLSHQTCYRKILQNSEENVLILEDDLFLANPNISNILKKIELALNPLKPEVVLLSGDYWWTSKNRWYDGYSIVSVYDASCSQSYVLNKMAAAAMIEDVPFFLADDWLHYKKKMKLKAIFPHLMDQNRADFSTEVIASNVGIVRDKLSVRRNVFYYFVAMTKMLLLKKGHFESKYFKNGKE